MSHNIPEKFGIYASEKLKLVKGAKFAEPRIPNSEGVFTGVQRICRRFLKFAYVDVCVCVWGKSTHFW